MCRGVPSVGMSLPEGRHDNPIRKQIRTNPTPGKLPNLLKDERLLKAATHFGVPVRNHIDPRERAGS